MDFIRIAITPDDTSLSAEAISKGIHSILREGAVDIIHLRRPLSSEGHISDVLSALSPEQLNRVTLHDYHHLANEFNCGGIHLNSHHPDIPDNLRNNIRISKSCHTIDELTSVSPDIGYTYLTLSPIYDSISKIGYKSQFDFNNLSKIIPECKIPIIALGGITPDKITQVTTLGFSGAAMLGFFRPYFK